MRARQRPHRGERQERLGRVEPLVEAVAEHDQPVLDDVEHARVGRVVAADVVDRRRGRRPGRAPGGRRTRSAAARSRGRIRSGISIRIMSRQNAISSPASTRASSAASLQSSDAWCASSAAVVAVRDDRHVERRPAERVVPVPVRQHRRAQRRQAERLRAPQGTTPCARPTRRPRAARVDVRARDGRERGAVGALVGREPPDVLGCALQAARGRVRAPRRMTVPDSVGIMRDVRRLLRRLRLVPPRRRIPTSVSTTSRSPRACTCTRSSCARTTPTRRS